MNDFKPRNPVVQDSVFKHQASSGPAAAGCVVHIVGDQEVACVTTSGDVPFGFLGQNVIAEPSNLPKGFRFPGQLGSSDAFLGDPVMVAHSEGTYETTHYVASDAPFAAGDLLYVAIDRGAAINGRLTNNNSGSVAPDNTAPAVCAVALSPLTAIEAAAGKPLLIKLEL